MTRGLVHLTQLALHFKKYLSKIIFQHRNSCFKITDTGLQVLAHEIGTNLPQLKILTLDLEGYLSIFNFLSLQPLISWKNITDLGLESLSYEICKSPIQLEKFTLLASEWNIIDRGVEVLSSEIVANLPNLKYLKLSFAR